MKRTTLFLIMLTMFLFSCEPPQQAPSIHDLPERKIYRNTGMKGTVTVRNDTIFVTGDYAKMFYLD